MTLTIPPRTTTTTTPMMNPTTTKPTATTTPEVTPATPAAVTTKPAIDGVDRDSKSSTTNASTTHATTTPVGTTVAPALVNEADLQRALATTAKLSTSTNPQVAAVFGNANDAAQRLHKATSIEVPIRLQVKTGFAPPLSGTATKTAPTAFGGGRVPSDLPGMLKEKAGVVTFYPADESLKPFDVDADAAKHLPRDTLLLARTAKKSIDIQLPDGSVETAPVYSVGTGGLQPARERFVGVIDFVAGDPFVRDLVPPPRMAPLSKTQADGKPWREGDIVEVRVEVRFDAKVDGENAIVERSLAGAGTPMARTWMVAASQKLDATFPKAAVAEAAAVEAAQPASLSDKSLVDLTHLPFFAIDNDHSSDIDQAMHLEKRSDGGYVMSYALADAAHYVKPGTALFEQAMQRGASYYLPGLSIPMLPDALSKGVVSLNAHEDHRAMVLQVRLDKDGNVEGEATVLRAKIHSQAQLTYNGVSAELEGKGAVTKDQHGKPVPRAVSAQLKLFEEIGEKRIDKAKARGVVEPDRREMEIGFDEGKFFLHEQKSDWASKLNAELSILANVKGAEALASSKIPGVQVPGIFRVHAEPQGGAKKALARQVAVIVEKNGLPSTWLWQKSESLAQWVDRLKVLPQSSGAAGDRERALSLVLQTAAVRINVASQYERDPGKHSGLQLEHYGRFSAPMREQVGVMSHAVLFAKTALETAFDQAKLTPQQATALWAPLLLGAVVDPQKIPPARQQLAQQAQALLTTTGPELIALAKTLAAQAQQQAPSLSSDEKKLVDDVMNRAMNAGNTSKMKQGQVEGAGLKLLFDDLFLQDLGGNPLGNPNAPKRAGTVTSVTPAKVYVQLKDPDVEIRLSLDDLKRHCPNAAFHLEDEGVSLVGDNQAASSVARLLVGQEIQVQATHHDGDRLHFAVAG